MPFCTECGSKLLDDACFCTNCGTTTKISAAVNQASSVPFQSADTFTNVYPTSATAEIKPQGEYVDPAVLSPNPTKPFAQEYTPPTQSYYGYPPVGSTIANGQAVGVATKKPVNTLAIIAISVFVLVTALFAALFLSLRGNTSFIGYWESVGVQINGTYVEELYGRSFDGIMKIQVNNDGSLYALLAEDGQTISSASWEKSGDGFVAMVDGDLLGFKFDDGSLYMGALGATDSYVFVFQRANGSITPGNGSTPPEASTRPAQGSGYVGDGDYYVKIVGADEFEDTDGDQSIRFYYEFTNESDYTISAWEALDFTVTQDGAVHDSTYAWDDIPAYDNTSLRVRPGVTIQCCYESKYDINGGSVVFTAFGWDLGKNGGSAISTYVPGELPGAPAALKIVPITDPEWTINIASEGTLGDYDIAVSSAEAADDEDYGACIRVYYTFTNNSGVPAILSEVFLPYTYQDGIALQDTYITELDTDEAFYASVEPGATITASFVFVLRNNTSPVEAEINLMETDESVGTTYDIT